MLALAVAFVLTALVVGVILIGTGFRDAAFCPRREAMVEIVGGRCRERAGSCAAVPVGCERDCIALGRFGARA